MLQATLIYMSGRPELISPYPQLLKKKREWFLSLIIELLENLVEAMDSHSLDLSAHLDHAYLGIHFLVPETHPWIYISSKDSKQRTLYQQYMCLSKVTQMVAGRKGIRLPNSLFGAH